MTVQQGILQTDPSKAVAGTSINEVPVFFIVIIVLHYKNTDWCKHMTDGHCSFTHWILSICHDAIQLNHVPTGRRQTSMTQAGGVCVVVCLWVCLFTRVKVCLGIGVSLLLLLGVKGERKQGKSSVAVCVRPNLSSLLCLQNKTFKYTRSPAEYSSRRTVKSRVRLSEELTTDTLC